MPFLTCPVGFLGIRASLAGTLSPTLSPCGKDELIPITCEIACLVYLIFCGGVDIQLEYQNSWTNHGYQIEVSDWKLQSMASLQ